ncbi:hypothetical protein K504DRAFT_371152 [Pleomassaria siparia CBS 279.74]|uniref:Cytochrome c oxidase assembly protein COX20, mitochondrial n=1 Tax=Pleomassaria siparia CBS 279.74 TaxID=1314801 RepID=A0A6G1KMR4_9PLEO|nr:hypothetical protein K504DRAFT_371152 [Pleomassaria siparia CBS 279.74]
MADDTRKPNEIEAPSLPLPPKGPANIMPGGTAHTAGGKPAGDEELTYFQVVKRLGPEYYLNYHKRPCVRDSQLTGIASGFAGGSMAGIVGRGVMMSCHFAVGTWVATSVLSYQYCQYQRSKEKKGMRQAHELMDRKRATAEAKREARRKAKEEYERREEERIKEEEKKKTWSYWLNKNAKFW